MILCDVNVLLGAMIERSPHHAVCRGELERLRSRPREMALSELILAAVVRTGSNPRVFRPTPTPEEVFRFVEALTAQAEVRRIEPGPRHWMIFRGLVLETGIRGSDTTDAYLAALAMEHGVVRSGFAGAWNPGQLHDEAQGLVDRLFVRKRLGDIRVQ